MVESRCLCSRDTFITYYPWQSARKPEGSITTMRILVIDDDKAFVRVLCRHLQMDGYEILFATSAVEGLCLAQDKNPDLILLDVRLPDMDGRQVCERLRAHSEVPVILLSAIGREADIVHGLGIGADGYLVKPFSMVELKARIRALLRRSLGARAHLQLYNDGYLCIDPRRRLVEKDGQQVELTPIEFKLLLRLLERRGQVVSRKELVRAVWGQMDGNSDQYLTMYICYLRKKLAPASPAGRDPHKPHYLRTRRGMGYWFCGQGDAEPPLDDTANVQIEKR